MTLSTIGQGFLLGDGLVGDPLFWMQDSPTALTASATLTAAQLGNRVFTANAATGAAVTYTLPTAASMDSAFPSIPNNGAFEFTVINTSTVAAEDATIAAGTGWTLVGNVTIASNNATTDWSTRTFIARKTGTGAWTLYGK